MEVKCRCRKIDVETLVAGGGGILTREDVMCQALVHQRERYSISMPGAMNEANATKVKKVSRGDRR